MTIQNGDLVFFCYRVFPADSMIPWKDSTVSDWKINRTEQVLVASELEPIIRAEPNNLDIRLTHFRAFELFERIEMVNLTLLSFAYLGPKLPDPRTEGPVFGGMGKGHKRLFTFKMSDGSDAPEPVEGSMIADWQSPILSETGCVDAENPQGISISPMEKDFGTWLGSLIKALDFDIGTSSRERGRCWLKYEVLPGILLTDPGQISHAALVADILGDQKILPNGVKGANGRGSSDR